MISFVIPAYNEEQLLPATLRAVHAAAQAVGEPYEIIVADDASTDQTASVARAHDARVVPVARRQIAAARNAGGLEARGDLLLFVDADTLVGPAVVQAALDAVRAGAVGGGCAVQFDEPLPRYARILLPVCVWLFRTARLASGCFVFCTRQAFQETGGFNEELFGAEELAMSQALKHQGRFVVLRSSVMTSGRKLRAYSGWEICWILLRISVRGWDGVRQRTGMEIWYGERRLDPAKASRSQSSAQPPPGS